MSRQAFDTSAPVPAAPPRMINLAGIIPAIVTPMHGGGDVDLAAIPPYIDWLVAQGPVALAVNVDTGEGPHLSRDERRAVLETVVAAVDGRVGVVAGVGGPATRDAIEAARQAAAAGADSLLVFPVPAFISQPLRADMVVDYHLAIADAVGLPLILFQLQPALGGVIFPPSVLERLLAISSVAGIKEASFDTLTFTNVRASVAASGRPVTLLTGNDNFIAESLLLGATGALLGFATLGTREHVTLLEAVRQGDMPAVQGIGSRLQRLADVIFGPPVADYRARVKEALRLLRVIPSAMVRPPLLPLPPAEADRVAVALEEARLES